ncbi:MAG: DUF4381 domain-containing protein [Pseudomonadota bacterium]|jgi:hypothetical protein|nr:DUF4381 domain-containing protein [Pseudomonadota bacterium]
MNQDLLAQLAPAHAPPPAGWWPPAPGWWLLLVVVLGLLAAVLAWWRHPSRRLRRAALAELRAIDGAGLDDAALAQHLESLTRRYAVARFGRDRVARLSGAAWLDFVVAHGGAAWRDEAGRQLLRAAYGGQAEADRAAWFGGARGFVSKGRPA